MHETKSATIFKRIKEELAKFIIKRGVRGNKGRNSNLVKVVK